MAKLSALYSPVGLITCSLLAFVSPAASAGGSKVLIMNLFIVGIVQLFILVGAVFVFRKIIIKNAIVLISVVLAWLMFVILAKVFDAQLSDLSDYSVYTIFYFLLIGVPILTMIVLVRTKDKRFS